MMSKERKESRTLRHEADLVIVGGGMAGTSGAVAAARLGLKTILIQNRPCLGGPASTECDSDSDAHLIVGGSNWTTRDARETGPIEEFRMTQACRWQQGWRNSFSQVLRDCCLAEPNLTLFLNTEVYDVKMDGAKIVEVMAKTMNSGLYRQIAAPVFLDCTGDGELGFLAGANFRMGREAKSEFGESLAPEKADSCTLGSSLYFRAVDTGKPVKFTPPPYAVKTTEDMYIGRPHTQVDRGYWWLECGGDMDTISDNEAIYDKLLGILYGIWDHLKNDGDHGADNYAIEWVSPIPAKRESRRLMGPCILTEKDILDNRHFEDAAAYSGGNVDLHPIKGFFSGNTPSGDEHGYHSPGLYHIPIRCLYSENVENLLMAGRNISVSHVALSSSRMMGTCSMLGQATAGMAFLCKKYGIRPGELGAHCKELQQILYRIDHRIPGVPVEDPENICRDATVNVTSSRRLELWQPGFTEPIVGPYDEKMISSAIAFPAATDRLESVDFILHNTGSNAVDVTAELVQEVAMFDFESGAVLAAEKQTLTPGFSGTVHFNLPADLIKSARYYIRLCGPEEVTVALEETYLPGVWKSRARICWPPQGDNKNLCVRFQPEQYLFEGENILTTDNRGGVANSVWISDPLQGLPQQAEITFPERRLCGCVELIFDTNLDHINIYDYQKECVKEYRLEGRCGEEWIPLAEENDNFLRFRKYTFEPRELDGLRLIVSATRGDSSARVYQIRAYADGTIR